MESPVQAKPLYGRAITRINPVSAGEILFKGQKITGKISKELDLEVIKKCQMIFQDPMASLNERAKVDYIISEGLINHHLYKDEKDRYDKVQAALREIRITSRVCFPLSSRILVDRDSVLVLPVR